MSHLFGYAKGAFTGADEEKMGIIDQADGGMLFLDEIHRLPPEGQEMIFYFMDHGTYSRLGETTKSHEANVRIVGATTEDPGSSLLETFVRRIPINIKLPAFEKRPANEKFSKNYDCPRSEPHATKDLFDRRCSKSTDWQCDLWEYRSIEVEYPVSMRTRISKSYAISRNIDYD